MNALFITVLLVIACFRTIWCHQVIESNIALHIMPRREAVQLLLSQQALTSGDKLAPCGHPCHDPETCHADCRRCDDDCNRPESCKVGRVSDCQDQ